MVSGSPRIESIQHLAAGEVGEIAGAIALRSGFPVALFEPRPAYRFARAAQAMLNFSLKSEPKSPIEFEILDSQGKVIRKLETKGHAGINRMKWDLRYESPRVIALRTAAPDN